jgi:uncharacterized membrane protein
MSARFQTFIAGLVVLLPIVATVAVVAWIGSLIYGLLGPGSLFGGILRSLGIGLVNSPLLAYFVGLMVVLGCVYLLGAVVQANFLPRIPRLVDAMIQRIPVIGNVYDLSKRFVGLLERKNNNEFGSMSPVWCFLGGDGGAAVLGLLPRPEPILVGGEPYHAVLVPFAPVPFGGTLAYVPAKWVVPADMRVENLITTYVSMGVSSPNEVRQTPGSAAPPSAKL